MLSTAESAVYDRQIRLWGVSAQAKLKSSTCLISGLSRVNIEVAKNLVLAGTNVILHSSASTQSEENLLTLLEPSNQIGLASILDRTAQALQTLNPLASVSVLDSLTNTNTAAVAAAAVLVDYCSSYVKLSPEIRQSLRSNLIVTLETSDGTLSVLDFDNHEINKETKASKDALPGRVFAPSVEAAIAASRDRTRRRREPKLVETSLRCLRGEEDCAEERCDFALAAITGGLLAQEVVKKITGTDVPLVNALCVDEMTMGAFVFSLGESGINWLGNVEEDVEIVGQAAQEIDL